METQLDIQNKRNELLNKIENSLQHLPGVSRADVNLARGRLDISLPDGEAYKTLETLSGLYDKFVEGGLVSARVAPGSSDSIDGEPLDVGDLPDLAVLRRKFSPDPASLPVVTVPAGPDPGTGGIDHHEAVRVRHALPRPCRHHPRAEVEYLPVGAVINRWNDGELDVRGEVEGDHGL